MDTKQFSAENQVREYPCKPHDRADRNIDAAGCNDKGHAHAKDKRWSDMHQQISDRNYRAELFGEDKVKDDQCYERDQRSVVLSYIAHTARPDATGKTLL